MAKNGAGTARGYTLAKSENNGIEKFVEERFLEARNKEFSSIENPCKESNNNTGFYSNASEERILVEHEVTPSNGNWPHRYFDAMHKIRGPTCGFLPPQVVINAKLFPEYTATVIIQERLFG